MALVDDASRALSRLSRGVFQGAGGAGAAAAERNGLYENFAEGD